jgi:hypothetical protein
MKIAGHFAFAVALLIPPFVLGWSDEKRSYRGNPDCANSARQALSKSVRDRLLADEKVDLTGVKVVSSSGTVYLSGTVQSLDARQQTVKIAWNAPGVQSVINALKYKSERRCRRSEE